MITDGDIILERLDRIERLALIGAKSILSLDEAILYTGFSKSFLYRMTSTRMIPHFKRNGKLYFKKSELEEWILDKKIATKWEIDSAASTYVATH